MSASIAIIRKVYDWIESALWAALAAFIIYFLIYVAPNLPEISRQSERVRIMKAEAENSSYCEKWGMTRGTHEHTFCMIDLRRFRKKIEQEFSDENVL